MDPQQRLMDIMANTFSDGRTIHDLSNEENYNFMTQVRDIDPDMFDDIQTQINNEQRRQRQPQQPQPPIDLDILFGPPQQTQIIEPFVPSPGPIDFVDIFLDHMIKEHEEGESFMSQKYKDAIPQYSQAIEDIQKYVYESFKQIREIRRGGGEVDQDKELVDLIKFIVRSGPDHRHLFITMHELLLNPFTLSHWREEYSDEIDSFMPMYCMFKPMIERNCMHNLKIYRKELLLYHCAHICATVKIQRWFKMIWYKPENPGYNRSEQEYNNVKKNVINDK